jgi:hypothetical protein
MGFGFLLSLFPHPIAILGGLMIIAAVGIRFFGTRRAAAFPTLFVGALLILADLVLANAGHQ